MNKHQVAAVVAAAATAAAQVRQSAKRLFALVLDGSARNVCDFVVPFVSQSTSQVASTTTIAIIITSVGRCPLADKKIKQ